MVSRFPDVTFGVKWSLNDRSFAGKFEREFERQDQTQNVYNRLLQRPKEIAAYQSWRLRRRIKKVAAIL